MSIVRARETFFLGDRKITVGQLFNDSDPTVSGRPHLFVPVESAVTVEQATARPGERRDVRVPAKAKKAKKG